MISLIQFGKNPSFSCQRIWVLTQLSLFEPDLPRPLLLLLLKAFEEKSSIELKKGHFWHVGNLSLIDGSGGYFAIGRTTKSIFEKYDEKTGNLTVESLETSPYTHVLFDTDRGFLSIAKKHKLSPTVGGIARKINQLIQGTKVIIERQIKVSIDPISDPYDFIESIKSAYSIRSFEVTFSRSNPFDADEFFQKPMERYLDEANGEEGKTTISGEALDPETLVSVSKSVAATGNDAKAKLRVHDKARYVTKHLRENHAHFAIGEDEFDPETALAFSRGSYKDIRGQS